VRSAARAGGLPYAGYVCTCADVGWDAFAASVVDRESVHPHELSRRLSLCPPARLYVWRRFAARSPLTCMRLSCALSRVACVAQGVGVFMGVFRSQRRARVGGRREDGGSMRGVHSNRDLCPTLCPTTSWHRELPKEAARGRGSVASHEIVLGNTGQEPHTQRPPHVARGSAHTQCTGAGRLSRHIMCGGLDLTTPCCRVRCHTSSTVCFRSVPSRGRSLKMQWSCKRSATRTWNGSRGRRCTSDKGRQRRPSVT
jgi:hypothetical protein